MEWKEIYPQKMTQRVDVTEPKVPYAFPLAGMKMNQRMGLILEMKHVALKRL